MWRLREGWARLPIGVRFLWLLLGVMLALITPLLGLGYLLLQRSLEAHQQLVQRQRLAAAVSALERELAMRCCAKCRITPSGTTRTPP
jgi:hypothetical protein